MNGLCECCVGLTGREFQLNFYAQTFFRRNEGVDSNIVSSLTVNNVELMFSV